MEKRVFFYEGRNGIDIQISYPKGVVDADVVKVTSPLIALADKAVKEPMLGITF